jgi:hypothetical protein
MTVSAGLTNGQRVNIHPRCHAQPGAAQHPIGRGAHGPDMEEGNWRCSVVR